MVYSLPFAVTATVFNPSFQPFCGRSETVTPYRWNRFSRPLTVTLSTPSLKAARLKSTKELARGAWAKSTVSRSTASFFIASAGAGFGAASAIATGIAHNRARTAGNR